MAETSAAPTTSVAICTFNRSDDVDRCLNATTEQVRNAGFPVLVIDSGSDAAHRAKLEHSCRRHGARYVRCDAPGLSVARNTALRAVATPWISFLDDDAVPHPDWARNLSAAVKQTDDDVAGIGGKISPKFPDACPHDHITPSWLLLLSCVEAAGQGDIDYSNYRVCGANLTLRVKYVLEVGGFPQKLGRHGGSLMSGEEAFIIERLIETGRRVLYNDTFSVDHYIPAARTMIDWAARRAFWEGASRVEIHRQLSRPIPATMNIAKLAASYPILRALSLVRGGVDERLRASRALGSLYWQVKIW
ncbi:MAG: glycosyltransferase family 2 protein [Pseudomonadota bacterium]